MTLSSKENKRAWVLGKVDRGEMTAATAGEVMGLSVRQIRRLLARYRESGPQGLVHGNRGHKPKHALATDVKVQVVVLAQGKYAGFNQQHFKEKLEGEKLYLSRSSVRRILLGAGIRSPRKRRPPKHRSRRERRVQRGMMLQIDGSRHDWLEGRGPYLTLVGAIDDATGEVPYCQFREQEDAQGYFLLLEGIALKLGLPLSLYSDRSGIFRVNQKKTVSIEEELRGEQELTQFGRALKELAIEAILALSPQAKGRIERLWGTFQDRLVSELRLAGAKTLAEANEVLKGFLPDYNRRFMVEAKEQGSAYRPVTRMKLAQALCFKYERTVGNDNTVQWQGKVIQIPPGPRRRSYAKAKVIVQEGMDGSVAIYYQGQRIAYEKAPNEAVLLRVRAKSAGIQAKRIADKGENRPEKGKSDAEREQKESARPGRDHPWRKPFFAKKTG